MTALPPHLKELDNPQIIGDHIRRQRLKLRLLQGDLAERFNVCEDTITGWENRRSEPQIQFYPKIIEFLGYNPFTFETDTLGGRIRKYRHEKGLSLELLADLVDVDETTLRSWELNLHKPFTRKRRLLEDVINQKEL